ncbi:unnamed protein product [Dovyalis caffra]|uniref:Partial AB-hydrolase lipase domain-containing protein n=1 Tax=Dovyalis caffra TaxID=77055 RepID=A0AAV1QU43_9ROSI|nr:unnamed protein product [Dovyalis caffra]
MESPEIGDEENRVLEGDGSRAGATSRNIVTNEGDGASREHSMISVQKQEPKGEEEEEEKAWRVMMKFQGRMILVAVQTLLKRKHIRSCLHMVPTQTRRKGRIKKMILVESKDNEIKFQHLKKVLCMVTLLGTVVTDDGYILSVQRIPEGRVGAGGNGDAKRQPVLIQHGVLVDGMTWLQNQPEQNLPTILADQGFDVWISNTRGTKFSSRHTSLQHSQQEFWNWSFDELAKFDLPALFDFVYNETRQKIHYVGHSQGTLTAMAALSEGLLVEKIKSAALLSPVAYLKTTISLLTLICKETSIANLFGDSAFDPKTQLLPFLNLGNTLCAASRANCYELLTPITAIRNGFLAKYDYGSSEANMQRYGKAKPPVYNLSNIPSDLPLFLSYGLRDGLSDVQDVNLLLDILKPHHDADKLTTQYIKEYAHMDFIFGVNAKDIVVRKTVPVPRPTANIQSYLYFEDYFGIGFDSINHDYKVMRQILRNGRGGKSNVNMFFNLADEKIVLLNEASSVSKEHSSHVTGLRRRKKGKKKKRKKIMEMPEIVDEENRVLKGDGSISKLTQKERRETDAKVGGEDVGLSPRRRLDKYPSKIASQDIIAIQSKGDGLRNRCFLYPDKDFPECNGQELGFPFETLKVPYPSICYNKTHLVGSIRKTVPIPTPTANFKSPGFIDDDFGFGFDSINHDYKLVRIGYLETWINYEVKETKLPPLVEVYSFKSGCWRMVENDLKYLIKRDSRSAFVNGACHWTTVSSRNRKRFTALNVIVFFDLAYEKIGEMVVPDCIVSREGIVSREAMDLTAAVFDGLLSLVASGRRYYGEGSCSIWQMKEYGDANSWIKLLNIEHLIYNVYNFVGSKKNGEVFLAGGGELTSYSETKNGSCRIQGTKIRGSTGPFYLESYVESLVLLNEASWMSIENPSPGNEGNRVSKEHSSHVADLHKKEKEKKKGKKNMESPEMGDEENRVLEGDGSSSKKEEKKNGKRKTESDDELGGKHNWSASADTAKKEAPKELPSSGISDQILSSSVFFIDLCFNQMGLCFPSTPKKLGMTIGLFASGAALFAAGLHLSYVNIAPQQARIKARNDFVRDRLRKKYGKE